MVIFTSGSEQTAKQVVSRKSSLIGRLIESDAKGRIILTPEQAMELLRVNETGLSEGAKSNGETKFDGGKAPIYRGALAYFPRAIELVAAISAFGASKYAWNGWKGIPDGLNRVSDAMVRHLGEEAKGEVLDPESGFLHAGHAAWNALARLEFMLMDKEKERLPGG